MKWYYRFGDEDPAMGLIFSGSINTKSAAAESAARRAICKKHNYKRLPASTLVISAFEILPFGVVKYVNLPSGLITNRIGTRGMPNARAIGESKPRPS